MPSPKSLEWKYCLYPKKKNLLMPFFQGMTGAQSRFDRVLVQDDFVRLSLLPQNFNPVIQSSSKMYSPFSRLRTWGIRAKEMKNICWTWQSREEMSHVATSWLFQRKKKQPISSWGLFLLIAGCPLQKQTSHINYLIWK